MAGARLEQAGAFQPVQQGIQSSGADAVSVMPQFVHHAKTEDGFLCSMQQDVDADESVEEFAPVIRYRIHSISNPTI
jgi:hypothetical protein